MCNLLCDLISGSQKFIIEGEDTGLPIYLLSVMRRHSFERELSHVHTLEYPNLSHANYLEVGCERKSRIINVEEKANVEVWYGVLLKFIAYTPHFCIWSVFFRSVNLSQT